MKKYMRFRSLNYGIIFGSLRGEVSWKEYGSGTSYRIMEL